MGSLSRITWAGPGSSQLSFKVEEGGWRRRCDSKGMIRHSMSLALKMEEKDPEPRDEHGLQRLEKRGKAFFLRASRRNIALLTF